MSLYKRNNVYYYDFTINGKRYNRSTGSSNKREAAKIERIAKKWIKAGKGLPGPEKKTPEPKKETPEPKKQMRLSEAFQKCYEEKWRFNKDPKNPLARAKYIIRLMHNPYINDISNEDITQLIEKLERKNLTTATINRYLATLRAALLLAYRKWKTLESMPYIKLRREPQKRFRVVTPEEENMIVEYFKARNKEDMADLVIVLIDTGLRLKELLDLEYSDIDFDNGIITIWINKEGDRPKSVPMTSRVKTILLKRQTEGNKPFPLPYGMIQSSWRQMRKKLELNDVLIHTLRHTCATRLFQKGADIYTVKEYLGHSNISVTMRYAHMNPTHLKKAAKLLEEE